MRVLFMGTPAFAVPSLEALARPIRRAGGVDEQLATGFELIGVVTAPDRPKGRGQAVASPPVKDAAVRLGIPVWQPERVRAPEAVEQIRAQRPDLIVVVAFGQILPKAILEIPPKGCVNVHASLLPAYRGAAPIQWAIIRGEERTGITTILMDEGMDTGPMLMQQAVDIKPDERAGELADRLSRVGASLLVDTIDAWARGAVAATPQEHARATMAPLMNKNDGQIFWDRPAREIVNLVRGTDPWPGAWTSYAEQPWRIWRASVTPRGAGQWPPGMIAAVHPAGHGGTGGIDVATGRDWVTIQELQIPDRRRMTAAEFLAGHPVKVRSMLGEPARV
ncbi:MAG: methionyl-tRNA formyltransferase [Nitrospirae bacterium]|nr:methionyl-tRNA formyltransferase [Nitrospirota bacterium]